MREKSTGNPVIRVSYCQRCFRRNQGMSFTRVPGFLPSQSGFHFSNDYPPGTPYPAVNLPIVGTVISGDAGNGLCGGFVMATLDLFRHKPRLSPPPNTDRPPPGSPIFNYISGRLLDSFGDIQQGLHGNALRVIEWIHNPGHDVVVSFYGAGLAQRMIEIEWPKIKIDIDSGVPSPLNLVGGPERGVADIDGHIDTLHHCHQVLAYGYEVDSAKNLTLLVYDCNDPLNDNSTLSLNIGGDPRASIPIASPAVSAHMSGGIDVRGFFRSDYQRHDPSTIAGSPIATVGDFHSLAKAVNETTLGRVEDEIKDTRKLLDAVNATTLGRIEGEIKDLRQLLDVVNANTLGRMEAEVKTIQAKLGT
jgi:hypothetical protein